MKKFYVVFTLICMVLLNTYAVDATNEICTYYPEISSFIELEKGPIIKVNGIQNETFWQFKDINAAFDEINKSCNDLLISIQKKYELDQLSINNWFEYSLHVDDFDYTNHINYSTLKTFFDVCDNLERNNRTVSLAQKNDFDDEEMAMLLPYFSAFSKDYYSKSKAESRATFNVSAAVTYANKWATGYNEYKYRWWPSSDCTNFVSQVARAGGAGFSHNGINSISSWYYDNHTDSGHSTSWVRADYFVRHWGVKYSTTSYRSFAANISKGSFIATDFQADGKYDHCGFVTQTDASEGTYSGRTFKDFKIAQHTSNYTDWASRNGSNWITSGGLKVVLKTPY